MSDTTSRSLYIDNLRVFLIILVILLHLTITYVGIGGWYYNENEAKGYTMLPFFLFLFTNQSFFMGLFFLISSYFTVPSFDRKGGWRFLKDRFIRLGIPLLVFYFLINSITIYIIVKSVYDFEGSFMDFYLHDHGFGFGPMWFVETLIGFTLIYAFIRFLLRKRTYHPHQDKPFPHTIKVLGFAVLVGISSFIVRIWFTLGSSIPHTELQLPYFSQYIAMLILGTYVYKYRWFDKIQFNYGIRWFVFAQVLIFIVLPALVIFGGGINGDTDPYRGGLHWQSFALSVLEQVIGISIMIGLVAIFKSKLNTQDSFKKLLSGAAYTVYIIHPLILVGITIGLRNWEVSPYLKLFLLAPVIVSLCFLLAFLIRKIPYFDRVL